MSAARPWRSLAIAPMLFGLWARLAAAAPLETAAGHWKAVAMKDGRSWRFDIDVVGEKPETVTVDLVDLAAYGIPFTATFGKGTVHLERKTAAAVTVIDAAVAGGKMTGRLLFSGIDAPFTAERRGAGPPALAEDEVVFENGGVKLAGTVVHPAGKGPFPAMVCTHGSGPGDRQFAAYRSEGIFYARLGLAALIYDRRGSGKSTGDAATASMEDLADDALAGVRLLKAMPAVGVALIGVSGISQGGWIAPLAASRSSDVAFVIVTSASGINPMEQSIFDVSNTLRRGGFDEAVVSEAAGLRKRIYEIARTGTADAGLAAALEAVHDQPWFRLSALPYPLNVTAVSPGERQFLQFEPVPVWKKVAVPVLALWGGEDQSVPAERSRAIVEEALVSSGNRDHTLVLYSAGDHGLRIVRDKGAPWDFPRVVPGARGLVAEWVRNHTAAKANDTPVIPSSGETVEAFVPQGFHVHSRKDVDFNADGLADAVLVFEGDDEVLRYEQPRPLVVLFAQPGGGYRLSVRSDEVVYTAPPGVHGDHFMGIELRGNTFVVKDESGGLVSGGGVSDQYQFRSGAWVRIGRREFQYFNDPPGLTCEGAKLKPREMVNEIDRDTNLLTGAEIVKCGILHAENELTRTVTIRRKVPIKPLVRLDEVR